MDCIDKLLPESGIIWSILIAVYTKFSLIQGLEDAVDKLQRTHNSIQCLLIDAEALDIVNEAVKGWVCEMKTAAFDAENLIDEFQTLVDITKHAEAPSRRRKRSIPYLGGFMTLVKRRRIADDIAKIEDRLDEIRKSRMNLGLEPSDGQRRSYGSNEMVCFPTSANFDESRIFRRTKECDSVVAALKAKSVSNLRIVVIHGLPGIGTYKILVLHLMKVCMKGLIGSPAISRELLVLKLNWWLSSYVSETYFIAEIAISMVILLVMKQFLFLT
ncbi:putative disease resistance RPP13-like protein 1 [Zingiber officinale]|uniref:putative disease resistance RPP13-like protein 1 n=1 Tax=Zingiber officinale TaxID=94328 RepID=UPI001C4D9449|nr:putative disease resistance RPP13-like protein 1 [Zingiber officinale]